MTEKRHVADRRSECWNRALEAHATAFIFERRASRLRGIKRFFTFLGILVPSAVGLMAGRLYSGSAVPAWILHVASGLAVVQFLFSLWSLVTKWDDTLSDATQAAQKNYTLQTSWERLATDSEDALENKHGALAETDAAQRESDVKQHASRSEKCRGMRAGLFKYKRECAGCDRVPSSPNLSWRPPWTRRCAVCGELMPKGKT